MVAVCMMIFVCPRFSISAEFIFLFSDAELIDCIKTEDLNRVSVQTPVAACALFVDWSFNCILLLLLLLLLCSWWSSTSRRLTSCSRTQQAARCCITLWRPAVKRSSSTSSATVRTHTAHTRTHQHAMCIPVQWLRNGLTVGLGFFISVHQGEICLGDHHKSTIKEKRKKHSKHSNQYGQSNI